LFQFYADIFVFVVVLYIQLYSLFIEQQPHKKQVKQTNNAGVSRTRLSD